MLYNKKKRLVKELANVFENVSIADKNGKIFYFKNGKVLSENVKDKEQLAEICFKLENKNSSTNFLWLDGMFKQNFSKVIVLGKEPVLASFSVSTKETFGKNVSNKHSTIKAVMDHDTRLYKDSLTDTYNKLYLSDFWKNKCVNAVAMIDVDDFKQINDNYGHMMGDIVLRRIASTIKFCVSEFGKVVRFGGDEFVVLFDHINKEKLGVILRNISDEIANIKIENLTSKTSVSIGVVYGNGEVYDFINRADCAMYKMKRSQEKK